MLDIGDKFTHGWDGKCFREMVRAHINKCDGDSEFFACVFSNLNIGHSPVPAMPSSLSKPQPQLEQSESLDYPEA